MVDGERSVVEASDTLQINLQVIERVAARMAEQRVGIPPASPPDSLIDYCARRVFLVMRRRWE